MGALTIASIFAGMFSWPKAWMHSKSRQKAVPKTKQFRFMIYPFLYQRASSSIANGANAQGAAKRRIYHVDTGSCGVDHSFGNLLLLGDYIVTLADVGKKYEISFIKAVVCLHGIGAAFPWSIGMYAIRLSAGNTKPRPSERRSGYGQGGAEIQGSRERAVAGARQHQLAGV